MSIFRRAVSLQWSLLEPAGRGRGRHNWTGRDDRAGRCPWDRSNTQRNLHPECRHGFDDAGGELRRLLKISVPLRDLLTLYAHTFLIQATQTAKSNGRSKIEERLARWLLMAHDRLESDKLVITHEFLSMMLGVRRPGVTIALSFLEKTALITTHRGVISSSIVVASSEPPTAHMASRKPNTKRS